MKKRYVIVLAALAAGAVVPSGTVTAQRPVLPGVSAPAPPKRVGTLTIPKLHVTQPIYSGVTSSIFDRGVGQVPGSALPGQLGNMVIGGHRTSGMRPFYDIQKLRKGDRILVTRGGTVYTYVVNGTRIVKPSATWILDPTPTSTLTLFSCHPRGSIRQRYVVTASLQQ